MKAYFIVVLYQKKKTKCILCYNKRTTNKEGFYMMQKNRISFQTKNYKVILNLIQDLPYKLFCKKQFNNKNPP